jgi:hypothetical protein
VKDYPIPTCFCLKCGHTFDRSSNLTGKGKPDPGDLTLCIQCGSMLQFTDKMTVQLVDEQAMLAAVPVATRAFIEKARWAIDMTRHLQPKETKH